ncbi:MAG: Dabb family protein [Planctomycetes bacterium]|nr:Dabb family protein [Planctomycetota bacterium]
MVYFQLKERNDQTRSQLVAGCEKHLAGHPGTIQFAVGTLAEELDRPVNDRDFDVALIIIFKSRAAHDMYMTAPRHLQFIEEFQGLWEKVRVFDSHLAAMAGPEAGKKAPVKKEKTEAKSGPQKAEKDRPKKIALPDGAASFAGMIRGKVVERRGAQLVVQVEKVLEEWEHSKAADAKSLAGKPVVVDAYRGEGDGGKTVARFLKTVKVGEVVELDVAHKKGEALTVLELTEEQRARVKKD